MRLCSICDKKIEGSWCKNCRRFVKSYDSNISLYGDVQTKSTVTNTKSSLVPNTQKSSKRKRKKAAAVGISLSALFMCIAPFLPDIVDAVRLVSEGLKAREENRQAFEEEVLISDEEWQAYGDKIKRNAAMIEITPAERVIEKESRVFYYNPEDIKNMGYACDGKHFELCFEEFEQWLTVQWTDDYEVEEDSSVYSNLCSMTGESVWYRFATYRNYNCGGELSVRIEYDTATEQLHEVHVTTKGEAMDTELCYEMLKKFDPETLWTKYVFAMMLEDAVNGEEYSSFYHSEHVEVSFVPNATGYTVVFLPVEQAR